MRRFSSTDADFDARLAALLAFESAQDPQVDATVAAILADVKTRGDAAVLEYTQRLALRQRNVMAASNGQASTAEALFNAALAGGSAACGQPTSGLAAGNRADFSVVDITSPALLGVPVDQLLDAMVFSSPDARLSQVYAAGKPVVQAGRSENWRVLADDFSNAMRVLWA